LNIHHTVWLKPVLIGLAITLCGAAAADENADGAPGTSSAHLKASDSWFDINALDINVYGLSYHPDREAVHRRGLDNQVNPGLALHYAIDETPRGTTFVEAGSYKDSGSNWAKFAGVGYQFKLGESWKVGAAVALMDSPTYNRGATFIGMIPLVTYDLGRIKLNAVYFPKVANYNQIAAFGFYLSVPIGAWRK
jgi:hypothetical protein